MKYRIPLFIAEDLHTPHCKTAAEYIFNLQDKQSIYVSMTYTKNGENYDITNPDIILVLLGVLPFIRKNKPEIVVSGDVDEKTLRKHAEYIRDCINGDIFQ